MRRIAALIVLVLVANLVSVNSVAAETPKPSDAERVAKVRSEIRKLGNGPAARVEIKLYDGTKLKGYVAEATDTDFVIVEKTTEVAKTVPYPQVRQVKGNNLSTGAKVAIGVGIAFAILVLGFKDHIIAY